MAEDRLYAKAELLDTFPLGPGVLQRWRGMGYMHPTIINIYRKRDGKLLAPADDVAALSEALRDIGPPLNPPAEFVEVYNLLMNPQKFEMTGFLVGLRSGIEYRWPEPAYSSGVLVFVVGNILRGSVERLSVSQDYEIKCEVLRPPSW